MTEELVRRLRQQGYDAEYIGVKKYNTCHGIVSYIQYIESVNGKFINPNIDKYYTFNRSGCRNVTKEVYL